MHRQPQARFYNTIRSTVEINTLAWYSRYGWMDRFQNLDDIQLAVLLPLIAKRHCLVTTDEQYLDPLQKQLEKVGVASTLHYTWTEVFIRLALRVSDYLQQLSHAHQKLL